MSFCGMTGIWRSGLLRLLAWCLVAVLRWDSVSCRLYPRRARISLIAVVAAIQLCVNDISPSATVLGTMNALALTINSGVRAFAPVLSTSIFASGIKWGFADGHLVWFFLVVLALGLNIACWFLPEAAEGRPKGKVKLADDDDDVVR